MANKTVKASQLTAGEKIWVRGNVSFSRITSKLEPGSKEFERNNFRRESYGANVATKAYGTISISSPIFKAKNPDAIKYKDGELVLDKENLTPLETYIAESFGKSKKSDDWFFSKDITGNLPVVGSFDAETKQTELVTPKGELASGQEVSILLRVFKTKQGTGVGVDAVIVNGPIRYFGHNEDALMSDLAELGAIVDHRETPEEGKAETEKSAEASVYEDETNETEDETEVEDINDEDMPF